ncbi:HK97 gp10 family phage protein [Paraburkholderia sp. BL8N3]|nr:HK97-gp10 family putative phage morphogenesis protein [Paraburkholderia sp. BL8N3]TCK37976.1 HK97 gp10 family phage protein [Paraburkholderia sp. BL8N3]
MIKVDSQVKGLAELDRFLATLPEEMQRRMLRSSLMKAADPIVKQAQQNIANIFGGSARYTGTLEAGIMRGSTKKTGLAARVNVKLRKNVRAKGKTRINGVLKEFGLDPFYGRFLELGTSKMAPRPWLKPAAMARQDDAGRALNADLQKRIARWCKANGVTFKPAGV